MRYIVLYIKKTENVTSTEYEAIIGNTEQYSQSVIYDNSLYTPIYYSKDDDYSKINLFINTPNKFKQVYIAVEKPEYLNNKYVKHIKSFDDEFLLQFCLLFDYEIDEVNDNSIMLY